MNKLELKHIAPYLPYNLRWFRKTKIKDDLGTENESDIVEDVVLSIVHFYIENDSNKFDVKPILRPMTDLLVHIQHEGKKLVPFNVLRPGGWDLDAFVLDVESRDCRVSEWEQLIEWHFDVFGLIDKGLAVSVNDIKPPTMNLKRLGDIYSSFVRKNGDSQRPQAIIMHPVDLVKINLESTKDSVSGPASSLGECYFMGVKIYRSTDVEMGDIIIT